MWLLAHDGHEALLELVSNLQSQLDGLASRVGPRRGSETTTSQAQSGSELRSGSRTSRSTFQSQQVPSRSTSASISASRSTGQRFCGPTSPEYSLNVAQMKLRQGNTTATSPRRTEMASIEDEALSDDEAEQGVSEGHISVGANVALPMRRTHPQHLFQIFSIVDISQAARLLQVYQDVIGELHPFVDIKDLAGRLPVWYARCDRDAGVGIESLDGADEGQLVLTNLALAIALRAETTSFGPHETRIVQSNVESIISAKLMSPASSIKDVEAVLMAALYHYFQDVARSAWRMCGLAGNMLRELGFHRRDVIEHFLHSDAARQEAGILIGSVLILDRQFSATTGLPSHFDNSSFEVLPISRSDTPYLKSMLSFIQISDKFNEPISSAARGEWHDDEDGFEVMDFQIEQWRKKSVGPFTMDKVASWTSDASSRPPSWAILLNLRAASVRSLLWRPWFFHSSRIEVVKERLGPALELVANTMQILSVLNTTSDVYRKQHPFYQHLLSSSSALFFLVIAYVEQNKTALLPTLPVEFGRTVSRVYRIAVTLARNYTRISQASRRLHKRLLEIGETLKSLRMVADDRLAETGHGSSGQATKRTPLRSGHGLAWQNPFGGQPGGAAYVHPAEGMQDTANTHGFGLTAAPDSDMQLGWAESLLWDWQGGGVGLFGVPGEGI
ncbi:hypothetical protein S40293_04084 [Stachybotrys chartarum IBT 40293]|nr:hypothetical protein S40293_04084 [Stachybotrys chartarum IBT 40293]